MKRFKANSEKVMEVIELCKGSSRLPAAVVVWGFEDEQTDQTLTDIAATEGMEIVDYTKIAFEYAHCSPQDIEDEWKRLINEAMMARKGVIIKRHFGDNALTRRVMVAAAKTGMKQAKVILLRTQVDPVKGFAYHREKHSETFSHTAQMAIIDNLKYGMIELDERIDYILDLTL